MLKGFSESTHYQLNNSSQKVGSSLAKNSSPQKTMGFQLNFFCNKNPGVLPVANFRAPSIPINLNPQKPTGFHTKSIEVMKFLLG